MYKLTWWNFIDSLNSLLIEKAWFTDHSYYLFCFLYSKIQFIFCYTSNPFNPIWDSIDNVREKQYLIYIYLQRNKIIRIWNEWKIKTKLKTKNSIETFLFLCWVLDGIFIQTKLLQWNKLFCCCKDMYIFSKGKIQCVKDFFTVKF